MIVASLILVVAGLVLLGGAKHSRAKTAAAFVLLSFSVFAGFFYAAVNMLTENGLDESFFYHLQEGVEGADLMSFDGILLEGLGLFALTLGVALGLLVYLHKKAPARSLARYRLSLLLLVLSLGVSPVVNGFYDYYMADRNNNIAEFFVEKMPDGKPAKNILYIYMESVEQAYFDNDRFPGLTPHIHALMNEAVVFDNVGQTFGAEWTIAGMVASQCGMPLAKPGKFITQHGLDRFLPEAVCLGDLLKNEGYELNYLGGADTAFASKGVFYESHGFSRVEGFKQLQPSLSDPQYKTTWGLLDDTTFDLVAKRYTELAKTGKPFGVFTLTLDTHSPFVLSKSCNGIRYGDGKEGMLNAVKCTDKLVGDLVKRLSAHPAFKDTVVVIASDHTGINVSNIVGSKKNVRNNFLMLLNSGHPPAVISKPGTTLDVAPTLLQALGYDTKAFGLGRSLLSDEPTLQEQIPSFGLFVSEGRDYFYRFWKFASAQDGVEVAKDGVSARMGSVVVQAPFMASLNDDLGVVSQFHLLDGRGAILRYFAELSFGTRFLWLDKCREMAVKGYTPLVNGQCLAYGRTGGKVSVEPVQAGRRLSPAELLAAYDHWPSPLNYFEEKRVNENLRDLGMAHPYVAKAPGVDPKLAMVSSVNPLQISVVMHQDFGFMVEVDKGFSVVGLSQEILPKVLYRQRCDQPDDSATLNSLMAEKASAFAAVAVVYRKDEACDAAFYRRFFADSGLRQWEVMLEDKPYIAVLDKKRRIEEFTAQDASTVAVRF